MRGLGWRWVGWEGDIGGGGGGEEKEGEDKGSGERNKCHDVK